MSILSLAVFNVAVPRVGVGLVRTDAVAPRETPHPDHTINTGTSLATDGDSHTAMDRCVAGRTVVLR